MTTNNLSHGLARRIELVCHGREYDLPDSEHHPTYLMWLESVARWGVESPPALGCLLALGGAAWCDPYITVSISVTGQGECVFKVYASPPKQAGLTLAGFSLASKVEALVAALEASP